VQTHNGDRRTVALGAELTQRLRAVSEELGATLYTTLLAAFNVLLYRYSGQSDLIVGTAAAGRSHAAATDVVGYFVNSLPIRANLAGSPTFGALVAQLKRTVSDAIAHQEYPLALLVERLRVPRDLSRTPLFQVMFVYQRAHLLHGEGLSGFAVGATGEAMRLGPLQLEPVALDTRGAPFDLNLLMAEAANGLQAELTYNSDLFDGATIERMLEHYVALLKGVSAGTAQPIDRLPLLPEAERELVVERFNQTAAALPIAQPIDALFEAQVARTPGAVALVAMGAPGADGAPVVQETLSYAELDARANRLAQQLRALGVRPGRLVAVSLERSAELVVAVLGVLKAGGAYLPVDPDYPAERIAFMLGDARPVVLVSDTATAARIGVSAGAPEGPQLLLLDAAADAASEGTAPERLAGADDLAYVIYTSGSTGRPKGVLIEHRGLCNLVLAQIEGFGLTPASRTLQFASFSFDASVSEIFTALVSGGRLYLAGRETLLSSTALPRLIREEGITTVTLPPSLLAVLQPDELPGLQTVVSAGEALSVDLARRWSAGRRVINAYGPTEATIGPTMFDTAGLAPDAAVVPIGRPIANMQIYILDQLGQPLPVGVAGEICIGGVGLARGYLNRPELTAEKFVPCDLGDGERRRIYRTGDLGRFRADGTIECLGRLDQQVKIRGLRIELGEVEAQLRAHPAVREACVAAREDRPGDRRLVAYLVTGAPLEELIPVLRAHLLERLPEFMLPSAFVQLEALPLTPNGKVNQRALPAPASRQRGSAAAAPQSELERAVARIWGEALGVEGVGLHDNFFELGGHSLLMVKVHGQLQELVGRELSIVELFRYPTIATLAGHLSQAGGQGHAVQAQSAERAAQQRAALQQQQLRMQAAAQLRRGPNRRG
jgi:amino acid adenylation domain-containing protein